MSRCRCDLFASEFCDGFTNMQVFANEGKHQNDRECSKLEVDIKCWKWKGPLFVVSGSTVFTKFSQFIVPTF